MKHHKRKETNLSVYDLEGPVEDVITSLRASVERLDVKEPQIEIDRGYYDDYTFTLWGWRPMTPKEIAAAERKAEQARKRRVEKERLQREYELRQLAKLAERHGKKVIDAN